MIWLLLIPLLVAGSNFQTVDIDDHTHTVSILPYHRIWDGSDWVRDVYTNDPASINYKSNYISFSFNKADCSFQLKLPSDNSIEIEKYYSDLQINNIQKGTLCSVDSVVRTPTWTNFTINHGEYQTLYSLNFIRGLEITYISDSTGLLTITETCERCTPKEIRNGIIDYGFYSYDPKDEQHNSLKSIEQNGQDYKIIYEKTVDSKSLLLIDPTFSSNNPAEDSYFQDSNNNGVCDTASVNGDGQTILRAGMRDSSSATDCFRAYVQWDISSIPDNAFVTDTVFKFDVDAIAGSPETCDIMQIRTKPSTATDATIFTDIGNGTVYVNNSASCQTVGDNKSLDLGLSADDDIMNRQLARDWFAIGIKGGDETQIAADEYFDLVAEEGTGTPDPTLEITYTESGVPQVHITQNIYNIGDALKINGTALVLDYIQDGYINITSIVTQINGTTVNTNSTGYNQTEPYTINLGNVWAQVTSNGVKNVTTIVSIQNASGHIITNSTTGFISREYSPVYLSALVNPSTQGDVNYTLSRINNQDGIWLKVNRQGGALSSTWQIECITQTNTQAIATKNQSDTWSGTWKNETGVGYFNTTWSGLANTHAYVTCFNDDLLFTTTSYTNSSLALFGVGAFDATWGSMLGVPVAVFAIVMTAGQANKRDAPTWIVVILALAGIMATLGFFAIEPIVWGLALLSGMLGLFVNQKVF